MLSRSLRSVSTSASGITVRGYKKTIEQLAKEKPGLLKNANVLVRVDFNVPLDKKNPSKINDDTRIREALPTINFLSNAGAKVILASHCGRPDGKRNDAMKMAPMAQRLSELIKKPVVAVNDCIGTEVDASVAKMNSGDVIMLENARFYPEEEKNEPGFAAKLAKNAKIYVNDAFGTAHRAHASTEGVCKFVDHKVAGFLLEKEIKFLKSAVDAPKRPFAAIVGGAKVSTKIDVITSLIQKCDKIFIGGAMMFTFYRAMGLNTGKSMVEEKEIDKAKMLMDMAKSKGVKFLLPTDVVIAKEAKQEAESKTVSVKDIPADWIGLDIGSESLATFQKELADCKTIVWNGPMGLFEVKKFSTGTFGVAQTMADLTSKGAITIVGGGDSVAAVAQAGLESRMSHISTGGGASLEMLEGKVLPGVAALDDA